MRLELNEEQIDVLASLLDSRIQAIRAGTPSDPVHAADNLPPLDLETLQGLLERFRQAQRVQQMEAWKGYAETRKVPCNPPPGGGPA